MFLLGIKSASDAVMGKIKGADMTDRNVEHDSGREGITSHRQRQSNWGPKLFLVTAVGLTIFFWWLLIYSGGVVLHH